MLFKIYSNILVEKNIDCALYFVIEPLQVIWTIEPITEIENYTEV